MLSTAEAASLPKEVVFDIQCSCVTAIREFGANIPKGHAKDLPVGKPPVIGGVVKLKYGEEVEDYHLAYIVSFHDTEILIKERNFIDDDCGYSERFIPFDDEHIVGFWSP